MNVLLPLYFKSGNFEQDVMIFRSFVNKSFERALAAPCRMSQTTSVTWLLSFETSTFHIQHSNNFSFQYLELYVINYGKLLHERRKMARVSNLKAFIQQLEWVNDFQKILANRNRCTYCNSFVLMSNFQLGTKFHLWALLVLNQGKNWFYGSLIEAYLIRNIL